MPYYRRGYKKRYYKKRKKYSRKNIFWWRLKNKAIKGGLKALKYLNSEEKFLDTQLTLLPIANTVGITNLVTCQQGDTSSTRQGDQIKITSILFKYIIKIHASATNSSVRMLICLDKQANSAQMGLATVLKDVTNSDAIVSANNLDNKFRFTTLLDRVIQLSTDKPYARGSYYKKCGIRIRYDGNLGDVTDLASRNILLYLISDEGTNTPSITCYARLRFVDN